jgi:hypothetical protein
MKEAAGAEDLTVAYSVMETSTVEGAVYVWPLVAGMMEARPAALLPMIGTDPL